MKVHERYGVTIHPDSNKPGAMGTVNPTKWGKRAERGQIICDCDFQSRTSAQIWHCGYHGYQPHAIKDLSLLKSVDATKGEQVKDNKNTKPKLERVSVLCLIGFHAWGEWSEPKKVVFFDYQHRRCVRCNRRSTRIV